MVASNIDPNYFGSEADLDLVVRTIEFVLKLYATPPLSDSVVCPKFPQEQYVSKGKEGLKEYVREYCSTSFHPIGTASMLPRADGGVVDSALRVYGTSNLRIVSR